MNKLNNCQINEVKHNRMFSAVGIREKTDGSALTLNPPCRRVWVGGAGDLTGTYLDGSIGTIPSCPAGSYHDVVLTQIAASTTATDVVAFI